MKIRTIAMACLTAGSLCAAAQTADFNFNEMTYTPQQTSFLVNTNPDAQAATLRIYNEGLGGKALNTVKMTRDKANKGCWRATVKGDLRGKFYTFQVKYGGKQGEESPGIFAKAVGVNGARGAVVDMANTDPQGWKADRILELASPADLVIYEMHHRDYSVSPTSGLLYKGKFLALTEPKAIKHLKELGVNAVHILPSFDYASVDETRLDTPQFNWGYDPVNYNVPEGSYSTNPYDPEARVREFKQMVQALHKAGIKVILDVVYNHTMSIDGSGFHRTCPGTFFRKNADGSWSNGSGCGNETASEAPIMREFMKQSVKYWMDEYHIDGFRFDLMGIHDIQTMNEIASVAREVNPNVYIYGEGWSAGSCAYPNEKLAMKAHVKQLDGIGAFCDDMRDALRGPFDNDKKSAFLAALPGNEESIKAGIVGAIEHPQVDYSKVNYSKAPWTNEPTQLIAYVSCHDDMCLVDRLKASIPGIQPDELIRLDLLAQTAVFTSQGVPFMLSGEEMLRDKKGVHNSFNSPDSINQLDWQNLERYPQVMNYYKGLIALRKAHKGFRLGKADLVRKHLKFIDMPQNCSLAFMLTGLNSVGDKWNNIIVAFNSNKTPVTFSIPQGTYTVVCRNAVINADGLETFTGDKAVIPAQSALILHD